MLFLFFSLHTVFINNNNNNKIKKRKENKWISHTIVVSDRCGNNIKITLQYKFIYERLGIGIKKI